MKRNRSLGDWADMLACVSIGVGLGIGAAKSGDWGWLLVICLAIVSVVMGITHEQRIQKASKDDKHPV
jgi:hypothetical protein